MKTFVLYFICLTLVTAGARGGIVLDTSNPPGTPQVMGAGSTSGPMFVNITSDNAPNDVMSGWNITLAIIPDAGASGTLAFKDPSTGAYPNPGNYIFGGDGIGIAGVNSGSTLSASDFFIGIGPGAVVSGTPGSNLLQMDFQASSNASGLFGIFALDGAALTEWTDGGGNAQLFTDVPDGSGMVRIGEVFVTQSVPEPSTLLLLGLASAAVAGRHWRRLPKKSAQGDHKCADSD